jgi:predicted porin
MQKKIIALAVAGLMSGAAFAQSNVTIYGIVDIGYSRYSGSENTVTTLTCAPGTAGLDCLLDPATTGTAGKFKSRNGLDSGMQSGSRIGFKGEEVLGGGNKVGFVLENSIGVDTGAGPSMTRQSYLYAAGGWGTVAAGRQYTPQFNMMSAIDPFGVGTSGDLLMGRGVYGMGVITGQVFRLDNLFAYISPSFGGLTVTAGYTANGIGDEVRTREGAESLNAQVWAINPVYSNGPIYASLNYHQVKIDAYELKNKVWDLGGTYNLGVAKLAGVYGQNKVDDLKQKQWMLGATVPVGAAGNILFSYARTKIAEIDDLKASKFSLGYTYDFSKRTNLYATYAKISTSDSAEGFFSTRSGVNMVGLINATNSATTLAAFGDAYTTGINLGVRHKF